jgi:hypothetical protein
MPAQTIHSSGLPGGSRFTPETFAAHFQNFRYEFRAQVQATHEFLARQAGDCDDYAILASMIFKEQGDTPRLISVRMKKEVHVVCYLEEAGCYLDYNLRGQRPGNVVVANSIDAIAGKVAQSFGTTWISASEFTYEGDSLKRLVSTVRNSRETRMAARNLSKGDRTEIRHVARR